MSSILKALRKLEEEKADRREGAPDIARDILRPSRRRRTVSWRGPAAVAGVVLLVAFAGFALLPLTGSSSAPELPSPPVDSVAVPADSVANPRPLAREPEPIILVQAMPAEPPGIPSVPPQIVPAAVMPTAPEPPVATGPPAVSSTDPETMPTIPAAIPAMAAPPPPVSAPEQLPEESEPAVEEPDPALAVERIIFHPEADARMAVVNGLPVMQGTDIEGATVEEILPDRVRFSRDGRMFENRPGK